MIVLLCMGEVMGNSKMGKDVIGKIKPSKVEFSLNLPPNLLQLRVTWEKDEKRSLSDEEFKTRLLLFYKEHNAKEGTKKAHQPRLPRDIGRI